MKQKITTLDDMLDDLEDPIVEQKQKPKKSTSSRKLLHPDKERESRPTNPLLSDANTTLEIHLKKTPQFKVLNEQLNLLKLERINYKKIGDDENIKKTELLIKLLSDKRVEYRNIFKNRNYKKEKEENVQKLADSPELKVLYAKKKELQENLKLVTPRWYVNRIVEYREQLSLRGEYITDNFDTPEVVDFLEDLDSPDLSNKQIEEDMNFSVKISEEDDKSLLQDYTDFCGRVSRIINDFVNSYETELQKTSTQDIMDITSNKLVTILGRVFGQKSKAIKEELTRIQIEASQERDAVSGVNNVTDIIFETFDISSEEKAPKEILASTNIPLVMGIAKNICGKYNCFDKYDDAVSYGLLGLTVAINKWYQLQQLQDSALSFRGFSNIYISTTIQKGLLELQSGGTISGNRMADIYSRNNTKLKSFIEYNPEFKDWDKDTLRDLVCGLDDDKVSISTQSDIIGAASSNDETDDADIWANMGVSKNTYNENYVDCKIEYENLIKSLKFLLGLFKSKTNTITGEKENTSKKLFDKYDLEIFLLYFGFKTKPFATEETKTGATKNYYNLTEICKYMEEFYAKDGIQKTFTNGALKDNRPGHIGRIDLIIKKLQNALVEYPQIKAGLEFTFNYINTHKEEMDYFSNNMEEIGTTLEHNAIAEEYSEDEEILTKQLANGKRLSDIIALSEENPFNADIASFFDSYQD